jgi:hypothetical protein
MDFALSSDQRAFQDSVRTFAKRELEAGALARAHSEAFPRDVAVRMAAAGLLGITIPEGRQGRQRIVAVEPEVAGEVVAGAERDADEGQVALDADRRHRRERAVPAGHADRVAVGGARDRVEVVALGEHVHVDALLPRRSRELVRPR